MGSEPPFEARRLGDGLHRLTLDDGRAAIVKRRGAAPAGFFATEAHGLELLRATGTLRVPLVHHVSDDAIVLEDLGSGRPRTVTPSSPSAACSRKRGARSTRASSCTAISGLRTCTAAPTASSR
jgi:hypothetical protein